MANKLNSTTALPYTLTPNLDDLLFDIITAIELSNRDRQVAEKRYRHLKTHLERPGSPLAKYLSKSESHIYAQGSMAIGATIVSGTDDDRFDLDALVEMDVPANWNNDQALDLLFDALKDFPGATEVERCTRCVQVRFAFMHMDVTILDPSSGMGIEHAGHIFHSPDEEESRRVPASPYGFSNWFRDTVKPGLNAISEIINARRLTNGIDRFVVSKLEVLAEVEQHDIPEMIPPRLDSEQVLSLKLLKRYINLCYEGRDQKRPPSIYLAKLAADVGLTENGLCAQLLMLADRIKSEMDRHVMAGVKPDERNPAYTPDRLNDRWPETLKDMQVLQSDMKRFITAIETMKTSEFSEIAASLSELFGESVSTRSVKSYVERISKSGDSGKGGSYLRGSGIYIPSSTILAPAAVKSASAVPHHNFHSGVIKKTIK